jgi:hypothetical protein
MGSLKLFKFDGDSWSNEHGVQVVCARCVTFLKALNRPGKLGLNKEEALPMEVI